MSGDSDSAGADISQLPLPEVIKRLQAGERDARSSNAAVEVLRRFQPLLKKYWTWHPYGQYEDFVQEVMLRLFIALPSLRDLEAFPGLFRRIVIGAAADGLRASKGERSNIDEVDEKHLSVEFDESLATAVVVRSYLELLSPREQEVVRLTFLEDVDVADAARHLGLSEGAVRMTRSRAIRRLRELLAPGASRSP